ncbi:uridine kinase [uncultured Jatrophihabitans sp.]|uniref:uridine kinase n=1 Tax=uncultured Jatrophihabitans sp. TaxID=1610747 RepID=UPI0035C9C912
MSLGRHFVPLDLDVAIERLADLIERSPSFVRVAIDGPPCAQPEVLAEALIEPLRFRGRPGAHVRAETFWRDASLRLEYGRHDVESYRTWLDAGALRREVLDPLVASGTYLPSLRDPRTNRSTREAVRHAEPGTVVLVSGALLLGQELPFDRTVHLTMSAAARARRTPEHEAWTLPAFDAYDHDVEPIRVADVVIKLDDPKHPAVRGL